MRFDNKVNKPVVPVLVTLHRDNQLDDDLDLYFDDNLVAFFADGKLVPIAFAEGNPVMEDLKAKGIKFENRENGNGFRIAINL